jgi:hypothetical protein
VMASRTRPLWGKSAEAGESESRESGGGESAVGQTIVRDFANYRVLDRLSMYERRIESSLYRTMNELRKLQHEQDQDSAAGANVSKAGRLRIAGKMPATRPSADPETMTVFAKQSQLPPGDGVRCTPYEGGGAPSRPESVTDFAKRSQSPLGDGAHGTAHESGDTSTDEGTPDGVTTNDSGSCKTEPMESACSVLIGTSDGEPGDVEEEEMPDGVTANATASLCGFQSAAHDV